MFGRVGAAALCIAAVTVIGAHAESRPQLKPTRDVEIVYRTAGDDMGSSAQKLQATYADGGRHVRLDLFQFAESKYPFASWIYDESFNRVTFVQPGRREYSVQETPTDTVPGEVLTADMSFDKQSVTSVVGQPCTNWAIKSSKPEMNGSVACITDEGALLRLSSPTPKAPPQLVAIAVRYASPSPKIFSPPAGYMRVAPSN